MNDFDLWLKKYNADDLADFSRSKQGLLWLKLKSIVRTEWLDAFIHYADLTLKTSRLRDQWKELYGLLQAKNDAHSLLDDFIRVENKKISVTLPVEQLVSELYKMRSFDWGGNYQNNLDRFLVDNFIKKIPSYDVLIKKINTDIAASVMGYVLCSWYNHWSSILIEHIFKEHDKVLPTIGMIKKVDFFVDQVPFDLKVTYLPTGYIAQERSAKGLPSELTELKAYAKRYEIRFDKNADPATQAYEITQKLCDAGKPEAWAIDNSRRLILSEVQHNSRKLIRWLYEQQGERRFDASNRLFLILVDTSDWDASWKLKRNMNLLKPVIEKWINHFNISNLDNYKVEFNFQNQSYSCYSDAIIAVKEEKGELPNNFINKR